jgi:hypothetical protein
MLYCEPSPYNPETPINSFTKDAQTLNFPTLKEGSGDHPFIFNTIAVKSYDKKRERYFSEGGKAKLFVSPTKFVYAKSMDVANNETLRAKKDMDEESTEETDELEVQQPLNTV